MNPTMKPHRIAVLLLMMMLASCSEGPDRVAYSEKIVVEGFIEEGRGAVVWLTKSMYVPYGDKSFGMEDVRNIPIRWGKVTVSDGEREEVLIGGRDPNHLLEYSYKGYDIKGELGHSYTLTVEYSGYTLTAVTSIPPPAGLGEITVEENSGRDGGLYQINTTIVNSSKNGYYMLTAKPADRGIYRPCLFGTVDGASLDGEAPMAVFRPMSISEDGGYTPTYGPDEHVMLRLTSVDREAFEFWSGFMNDVVNARNPLYPSSANLKSNIEGGGLGVWYGFSSAYADVDLAEYVEAD